MKIFVSSPLYSTDYKYNIKSVVRKLRSKDYEVYSPMEYTVPNAWDLETEEWASKVYEENIKQINSCDLFISIYYVNDSKTAGTSFEMSYAKSLGKKVITLTDLTDIPLMVAIASDVIIDYGSYHILDELIKELINSNSNPKTYTEIWNTMSHRIGNNWNLKGRLNALS